MGRRASIAGTSCCSSVSCGYTPAFALLGLYAAVVLWMYGSFWVTGAVMIIGGLVTYPLIWLLRFCHTLQKSRFFGCGDSEVVLSFHFSQIQVFHVALNAKHFNLEGYLFLGADLVLHFSCESGHVD